MSLNINQFALQAIKGQMDLGFETEIVSAQIDTSEAGTLVAGQAVKLVDSLGGVPKVIAVAANTDAVYGIIVMNIKNASFKALDSVEIATFKNACMYMEASAAIARGANVSVVVSGSKVHTPAGASGEIIIGQAYDKAVNAGDIIRVIINLPGVAA